MLTKKERKKVRRTKRKNKLKQVKRLSNEYYAKYAIKPYKENNLVPPVNKIVLKPDIDPNNNGEFWEEIFVEEDPYLDPPVDQGHPMPVEIQLPVDNVAKKQEIHDLDHEVLNVQVLVETGLAKCKGCSSSQVNVRDESVIEKVRASTVSDMSLAMGESMASRLKYFCDNVDFDHPDIQDAVREGFKPDSEFNNTLKEVMTFTSLAGGKEMPRLLGLVKDSFTKAKSMKDIRIAIYKPHPRTLRTQESRDVARARKTAKEIVLTEWFSKNRNWNDYPTGFSSFVRFNDSHADEIKKNEMRASQMSNVGLTALSASFKKRNEIILNFIGEQYAAFTKIKMIDTAIILSKVHGATFREDYKNISYNAKMFAKSPFWLSAHTTYAGVTMDEKLEAAKDETGKPLEHRKITVQECMAPDIFTFKPRAYPIHEFKVTWPKHVQETITAVEAHPDMNGKALFDQFWVIVPGITLDKVMHEYGLKNPLRPGNSKVWVVANADDPNNPNKSANMYQSAEDAEKALDFRLTADGSLRPVILGEKDGKCYFLTYWN